MRTEQELRGLVREHLTMNAAPHQPPRDPTVFARAIGSGKEQDLLIELIREEAEHLHINML